MKYHLHTQPFGLIFGQEEEGRRGNLSMQPILLTMGSSNGDVMSEACGGVEAQNSAKSTRKKEGRMLTCSRGVWWSFYGLWVHEKGAGEAAW